MSTVSVVIPTRNRPELLTRAIVSALGQTWRALDVFVVVDGPDPATVAALNLIDDPRLRWVDLPESVGGSEARNTGFRAVNGDWVALLDDDDEWYPTKIAEQMAIAETAAAPCLIATRYMDRRSNSEMIQPAVSVKPGQPISEYLFCETSVLGFRKGFLQTSTWLVPREALLAVPFTKGLPRNQDTDWLLRAVPELGLAVNIVWRPLAIFHNQERPGRVTGNQKWLQTMNWASENQALFTPRAFAYFIATVCTFTAKTQGEPVSALWLQVRTAFKHGRPDLKCLWLFFAGWFVYPYGRFGLRTKLQHFFGARARSSS